MTTTATPGLAAARAKFNDAYAELDAVLRAAIVEEAREDRPDAASLTLTYDYIDGGLSIVFEDADGDELEDRFFTQRLWDLCDEADRLLNFSRRVERFHLR